MTYIKKHFLKIISLILLLVGIFLLPLVLRHIFLPEEDGREALEASLQNKETIIDTAFEGTRAYALVSREGCSDYGDFFVIFEQKAGKGWTRVYENDFKDLKPWKIRLADVDGDGVEEILTAVLKTTHFDAEERNRMFIFNYEDKKLIKKWTGSGTAGVWKDFTTGDLLPIPGSELIFIEQAEGEEHLSIYYWFDFGFINLAESGSYKDIRELSIIGENRIQMTYDDKQVAVLSVQDGKITEAAPN